MRSDCRGPPNRIGVVSMRPVVCLAGVVGSPPAMVKKVRRVDVERTGPIEVSVAALPRIRALSHDEVDAETQALWGNPL